MASLPSKQEDNNNQKKAWLILVELDCDADEKLESGYNNIKNNSKGENITASSRLSVILKNPTVSKKEDKTVSSWARSCILDNASQWILKIAHRSEAFAKAWKEDRHGAVIITTGDGGDILLLRDDTPVPESLVSTPRVGVAVCFPNVKNADKKTRLEKYGFLSPGLSMWEFVNATLTPIQEWRGHCAFLHTDATPFCGKMSQMEEMTVLRLWTHEKTPFTGFRMQKFNSVTEARQALIPPHPFRIPVSVQKPPQQKSTRKTDAKKQDKKSEAKGKRVVQKEYTVDSQKDKVAAAPAIAKHSAGKTVKKPANPKAPPKTAPKSPAGQKSASAKRNVERDTTASAKLSSPPSQGDQPTQTGDKHSNKRPHHEIEKKTDAENKKETVKPRLDPADTSRSKNEEKPQEKASGPTKTASGRKDTPKTTDAGEDPQTRPGTNKDTAKAQVEKPNATGKSGSESLKKSETSDARSSQKDGKDVKDMQSIKGGQENGKENGAQESNAKPSKTQDRPHGLKNMPETTAVLNSTSSPSVQQTVSKTPSGKSDAGTSAAGGTAADSAKNDAKKAAEDRTGAQEKKVDPPEAKTQGRSKGSNSKPKETPVQDSNSDSSASQGGDKAHGTMQETSKGETPKAVETTGGKKDENAGPTAGLGTATDPAKSDDKAASETKAKTPKSRGRPKGSKNKPKQANEATAEAKEAAGEATQAGTKTPGTEKTGTEKLENTDGQDKAAMDPTKSEKKRRGRPKGSKNKPKDPNAKEHKKSKTTTKDTPGLKSSSETAPAEEEESHAMEVEKPTVKEVEKTTAEEKAPSPKEKVEAKPKATEDQKKIDVDESPKKRSRSKSSKTKSTTTSSKSDSATTRKKRRTWTTTQEAEASSAA